jgi:predicted RecB family nuclease
MEDPRMKITKEALSEYPNCDHKAHLLLRGIVGDSTAYEHWLHEQDLQYIAAATRALLNREKSCVLAANSLDTGEHMRQGVEIIVGAQAESELFSYSFHALQRIHGPSALGPFHYVPVVFSGAFTSSAEAQKLVLSCESYILEALQQLRPSNGILVSGESYSFREVDLEKQRPKANRMLEDFTKYFHGTQTPRLRLKDHCHICRYRQQCKVEAQQVDDLSLLNKMSEREIQLYQRKGIFTVNQLSYTFRFRKRGSRVKAHGRPHSYAASMV